MFSLLANKGRDSGIPLPVQSERY